jgi:glycosyltransferase involved in cell wall biosynthesis
LAKELGKPFVMKVTILSKYDYAGSGKRIADAVKKFDPTFDIISFVIHEGQGSDVISQPTGQSVNNAGRGIVAKRIQESDIIHFKGDWSYGNSFDGIPLTGKKIIYTFGGSIFRRKDKDYYPNSIAQGTKTPLSLFSNAALLTAFTPELCYDGVIKLAPFPYLNFDYRFKRGDKFRIMHIPSNPEKKGTDLILEAFKLINRNDVEFITEQNISYQRAIELKSTAHIYIDQMVLPVYGNSAVEAMAFGVPVLNWDLGLYPFETPIIKPYERTPQSIAKAINRWLDWGQLEALSKATFDYCKEIHGRMGERWIQTYNKLNG